MKASVGQAMPLGISELKGSGGDGYDSTEGDRPRLLTSNFVFATLANFVSSFSLQMLIATLPVYVIRLGGSQADAGLVSGAMALTSMLVRPFLGWLTDAWRRRPVVLMGISFHGLASVVYLLAGSIPLLMVGRLVQGLGLSCYTTAASVYVADIAPPNRRAEAVGLFTSVQAIGLIIGPVIGFVLVESSGFRHLFDFSIGMCLLAFFLSLFAKERRQRKIKREPWSLRTGIVSVDALPVAWMGLCLGIGWGAINAFIAIFAQMRGVQNPGFYFMFMAIALLVTRISTGRLADRYSRTIVIVPGVLLLVVAQAMLPLTYSLPYFVISASLFGIGFGSAHPAIMALLYDRVHLDQRGLATSTYFTGFDVGFVIGTILLGVVSQSWGFAVMWPISAACTLLSLAGIMAARHHSTSIAQ